MRFILIRYKLEQKQQKYDLKNSKSAKKSDSCSDSDLYITVIVQSNIPLFFH